MSLPELKKILQLNSEIITPESLGETGDENIRSFLAEWWDEKEHITVQTSGSTGIPKKIQLEKAKMLNSAKMTIDYFKLNAGTKALLCLPAQFIAGKMMLVRAIAGSWKLTAVNPDANPLRSFQDEENFDFAAMTPLQVENSISNPETAKKFTRIKKIIIGGGECSSELIRRLQHFPNECFATYGMTETITHVAVRPLNGKNASESFTLLKGIRCNIDERNCLWIDAPHLSAQPLQTNDIVEFTDLNKFKWIGRYDNVINSGGLKLFPELIEKKIEDLITDRRFYISSESDQKLGKKVVLVLEGPPFDPHTEKLLLNHLKDILPKNHSPKSVRYLLRFEETKNGKIKRIAF